MTEGTVTGGWGFVIAAYAITAAAFVIYGVSLLTKLRELQSRRRAGGDRE